MHKPTCVPYLLCAGTRVPAAPLLLRHWFKYTYYHNLVNCPDSRGVRAACLKARGGWIDSKRKHVFSFLYFALFLLLTVLRDLYK